MTPPPCAEAPAPDFAARLPELCARMDLALAPEAAARLAAYAGLLLRWNRVYNLTAITSPQELLTHHLLDCLAIVAPLERALAQSPRAAASPVRFLDAGSGAGLPGIVLAVLRPAWQATLVDAVGKKCAFLQQVRLDLRLDNVEVRHARLESERFAPQDFIVSRAFASLAEFVRLTRPALAAGGFWAAMKGRPNAAELAALPEGTEAFETITLRVPLLEEQRQLVLLRETGAGRTPPP